jgi:valyl-tRNA synthetase
MIKPEYGQPIDKATFEATIDFFEKLMALTHPFMPFITEEIWQDIRERGEKESLCVAAFPKAASADVSLLADFEIFFEIVTNIRNLRSTKNISPKTALPLAIKTENQPLYRKFEGLLSKLANVSDITYTTDKADGMSFLVKADEFFVNLEGELDVAAEIENLQKELEYTLGFKKSVEAKLSNERFVQNAKADIVEKERQKLADAEAKIATLQEALARMSA